MKIYNDILQQLETTSSVFTSNAGLIKSGLTTLKLENRDILKLPADLYSTHRILTEGINLNDTVRLSDDETCGGNYVICNYHENNLPIRKLGNPIPALAIVIASIGFSENEELVLHLKKITPVMP